MQIGLLLDLLGLLKLTVVLKMLPFLALKKVQVELVEDLQIILVQTLIIKDHLLKALIHLPPESRDQEITAQDLMINRAIIID